MRRQVTKGTVDEGIHAMAERKLRLDAAVLEGVTATGDGRSSGATVETAQVLLALATCLMACTSYLPLGMRLPWDPAGFAMLPAERGTCCLTGEQDFSDYQHGRNMARKPESYHDMQMSELLQSLLSRPGA